MRSYVWDTGALSQFYANNDIATKIMREHKTGKSRGYIPQLVFSEYYYKTWQKFGDQTALLRTKTLRDGPLKEYILKEKDTYVVGKTKLDHSFLSIVDAIVIATSKATGSTIITTDHDFTKVKGVKVKKIDF